MKIFDWFKARKRNGMITYKKFPKVSSIDQFNTED